MMRSIHHWVTWVVLTFTLPADGIDCEQCQSCCRDDTFRRKLIEGFDKHARRTAGASPSPTSKGHSHSHSHSYSSKSHSHSYMSHSSSSGSGCASAHGPWWKKEYEYVYVESWIIIVLVTLTLIFDEIHHKTEELADQQTFGKLSLEHVHAAKNMWLCLHQRLSGELSVLGFLALMVWCCNQAGLFCKATKISDKGVTLPQDDQTYLHMVEAVHMHLFLAMVFYFIILAGAVKISSRITKHAIDYNKEIKKAYKEKVIGVDADGQDIENYVKTKSFLFRNFFKNRELFFIHLQRWKGNYKSLDDVFELYESKLAAKWTNGDTEGLAFRNMFRQWFPFDAYMVANYRPVMDDMIEMKWTTWLAIGILLIAQAMIQRAVENDFGHDFVIWFVFSQVIILIALIAVARRFYKLQNTDLANPKPTPFSKRRGCHRFHPVLQLAKFVQVCLFFTCYQFARTIANTSMWEHKDGPWTPLLYSIIFVVLALPEGCLVGYALVTSANIAASGHLMQDHHVSKLTLIIKAHLEGTLKALRQDLDSVEEFEEKVEEIGESIKEEAASKRKSQEFQDKLQI